MMTAVKRIRKYPRWRLLALAGLVIIPLIAGSGGCFPDQTLPTPSSTASSDALSNLNKRGGDALNQGQYREALNDFQQALAIAREVGNRAGEGATLNNIGLVYDHLGLNEQALENYNKGLVIAREIGYKPLEETVLVNIADMSDN